MSRMRATKSSWKNVPISENKEKIPFEAFYSDSEVEFIGLGFVPESMDDKWFIYSEEDWVYFHRSWSGHCIFMVKLDGSPAGGRIAEAWVTRDSTQYNSSGSEGDMELLSTLIINMLVSRDEAT